MHIRLMEFKNNKYIRLNHTFEPVFDNYSQVLILGTFPSLNSRKYGFYYSHPQNRFWKVLTYLTQVHYITNSIDEKKLMLLNNKIALWDVIKSCDICGSSDNSIINVIPANLSLILDNSNIKQIFTNGSIANQLYKKYYSKKISIGVQKLLSTSSTNARYSLEQLIQNWSVILHYIK